MAASGSALSVDDVTDFDDANGYDSDNEQRENYQGPHNWRKRLKPVQSPIKAKSMDSLLSTGDGKDSSVEKSYCSSSRPLPPWKRDLIERNKKVARLVRRESSGRSKRSTVVRRESSGRSKKGNESPSGVTRKISFKNGVDNAFTQQVVNENTGRGRRISPANSFKSANGIRRTPSDKTLDPNDPSTKKRVERVRRARLYLLQQMGPNSFLIVGDSPEHKFKVIIGPQTCTCGKSPHCVHTLFVMLRVFQVSETDPCLWSKQLKNYEVENLFRIYHDKRKSRIETKKTRKNQKPSQDRSRAPSPVVPSESDAGSVREEDDTCPICLLEMLEGESLLKCDGCQNRLHHHCITVWFEECKRQKEVLICPLCRTHWKQIKAEEPSMDQPLAPPNTRAPSPQHEPESSRLPYAEPIPGEYINMSTPWIEILGEDLVSCLFSRNWSIRETGLKHLGKEMTRELLCVTDESRTGAGGMSMSNTDTMVKMLKCCFSVVALMCQDPVYKVFVGCLKVLRLVFAVTPSRDYQQRNKLQTLFKPVIDSIIVKCCDGTKRTSQLSISTMMELAKGQHGELALGRKLVSPGRLGLGGMAYLVPCLTEKYEDVTWQWLLGRLYIIEKLVVEFPTEFLPRQRPDGASSESSLELIGATSTDDEERPQNYDRLLIVAEFAIKAVSNSHTRISRVARRVFLLAARYAAHLENLITEFNALINKLDFTHKKSLKRQIDKILAEFQLSEQIGRQLHNGGISDKDVSPLDTPSVTPMSTPRCTSPVTTVSDCHSETGSTSDKNHPVVPPNTPIRGRQLRQSNGEYSRRSFQFVEEEDNEINCLKMKTSKSLDNLDSVEFVPLRRLSKSPVVKKVKSRSRSNTPIRVGPVLETNLDEVIKLEEKSRKMLSSRDNSLEDADDSAFVNDEDNISLALSLPTQTLSPVFSLSPSPRLLSRDLETDIDSVEPDLDGMLKEKLYGSCEDLLQNLTDFPPGRNNLRHPQLNSSTLIATPKVKLSKVPKFLSLDLDGENSRLKERLPMAPCAHINDLERHSGVGSSGGSCAEQKKIPLKTSKSGSSCADSVDYSNYSLTLNERTSKSKDGLKDISNLNLRDAYRKSFTACTTQGMNVHHTANQKSQQTDDLQDYMATTPVAGNEKPVTFKSEVAMATPKHSPSHTLDKDDDGCLCKEEVEREEALALAKAMEVSSKDPPKPIVPGLTPMDTEEVITIRIQPDDCDAIDQNGNPPALYYENMHWVKGPLLGTGAFSTCYQARDVRTGTIMALKQISFCRNSKTEQENVIETITEEIHMMAKLSHPHIVRIMGATRQGCHFNMFVEWMPGGSVSYLLGQYGRFSEEVMTHYVLQILRGLAYLHENHILHRDLKGANLLIDSTGQRLRIGDFGAAARLASKATGAGEFQGQLLGTIAFMAPEVLRGENYGRACDVWSVGCCLIEMATAKPPWNAHDISNHLALIFKIANSQSTPPVPEKLSPPLRDLLLRCLETEKEQRPSAKELLIHPLFTQYMRKK